MLRTGLLALTFCTLAAVGCSRGSEEPGQEPGSGGSAEEGPGSQPQPGLDPGIDPGLGGSAERVELSVSECADANGTVVGDIGDGAIHRPGYLCASGHPPLGRIRPEPGGPIGVEGSVCCPRP